MTSCIVGKKIGAVASGHLVLFPFVVLAICVLSLMAMAGGISEHILTSWSSFTILQTWYPCDPLPNLLKSFCSAKQIGCQC